MLIKSLIPESRRRGRPRTVNIDEVGNARLHRTRSGCPWGMLPYDFPCESRLRFTSTSQRAVTRGRCGTSSTRHVRSDVSLKVRASQAIDQQQVLIADPVKTSARFASHGDCDAEVTAPGSAGGLPRFLTCWQALQRAAGVPVATLRLPSCGPLITGHLWIAKAKRMGKFLPHLFLR
jgi:hypothetical protein